MTPCTCLPAHKAANTYSPTCTPHASYRCVTCNRAAVDEFRCGPCGRRVGGAMSAEVLRRAAVGLRDEWSDGEGGPRPMGTAWHRERDFHLAVADWLEGVAAWSDEGLGGTAHLSRTNWPSMWGDMQVSALTVARAYLGESA